MGTDLPLVTVLGASGFLGSAVAAALARAPVRMRLVARRPAPCPCEATSAEIHTTDLTSLSALATAVSGSDAVIHLVADISEKQNWRVADNPRTWRTNVGLVHELVDVLRGANGSGQPPICVLAASASQVGLVPAGRIDGSERDVPETAYDIHKLEAENALKAATAEGKIRGLSLRLPVLYGVTPTASRAGRGVVAAMVRRALAQRPLPMWHNGDVERDLLYVTDAAQAFVSAVTHADVLMGHHWVLGSGHGIRLSDLFSTITQRVAERTGDPPVSVTVVDPPEEAARTDFASCVVDPSAFHTAIGWRADTTLADGLRRTIDTLAAAPRPDEPAVPDSS